MTIYSKPKQPKRLTHLARNIYKKHHGSIPKDGEGRSYDIHHIDGDHHNDAITNLIAVPIQEHYDIHHNQSDWGACYAIALRMNKSTTELSELASKINNKRVKDGTHPWLDRENQSARAIKRVAAGTHPFSGDRGSELSKKVQLSRVAAGTHHLLGGDVQRKSNAKRIADGTHHFLSGDIQRQMVEDGTHPFLGGEISKRTQQCLVNNGTHSFLKPVTETHPTQTVWKCEHCNIEGKGKSNYKRWHGNKCKSCPMS
jgi:hypothetical protein